jgi:putative ABC transport system permease protein
MELFSSISLTLRAIGRNGLRSALTLLGIAIGVAVVITMVAIGTGAQRSLEQQIRAAGANLVTVTAGNFSLGAQDPSSGDVGEPEDRAAGDRIAGEVFRPRRPARAGNWAGMSVSPHVPGRGASTKLATADVEAVGDAPGVRTAVAGVSETAVIDAEGTQLFGRLQGTDAAFADARGLSMRAGTFLTSGQVAGRASVAVLSQQASLKLFGPQVTPVGKVLRTRRREFTVVGVVARTGALSAGGGPRLDEVYVPYTTLQDVLQISHLHSMTVAVVEAGKSTQIALDVTRLLRARHGLGLQDPDDFVVRTQARDAITANGVNPLVARAVAGSVVNLDDVTLAEIASSLERSNRTMTALLAAVASVSLLVGGVGIMNIMLVSVTERTREIGLRMAVGARGRDVLVQFLTEATTLSLLGGMAGVLIGVVAAGGLGRLMRWTTVVTPLSAAFAVCVAAAVGVFFGFYPARHASRLDPIEAMRFE